jgi:hypothetical protein
VILIEVIMVIDGIITIPSVFFWREVTMLIAGDGGSSYAKRRGNTASAPASALASRLPRPAQRTYSTSTSHGSANAAERRVFESPRATAKPKLKPASETKGIFSNLSSHLRQRVATFQASARRAAAKLDPDRIGFGSSRHPVKYQRSKQKPANFASATSAEFRMYAFEMREAQQRLGSARTRYDTARESDGFGCPTEIGVPKPEPRKPEPKESPGLLSRGVSWFKDKGDSALDKVGSAWDKTTDVVSDGASWVRDHKGEIGHTALDIVGTVDPTGLADGANAVWYLAEGDKVNAAISAAGMIPYVGDAAKAGKYGAKAYKATKAASEAKLRRTYVAYTIKDSVGNVRYVGRTSGYGSPERVLANRAQGHHILRANPELQKPQLDSVQGNRSANRGAEDVLYSRHQTSVRGHKNGARTVEVIRRDGKPIRINNGANFGNLPLLNRLSPIGNSNSSGRRYIEAYAKDLRMPS